MVWAMDATPSEGVEFLGVVALKGEAGDAVRGFGYWVGPPAWGLGYATEAAAAVATWAFADPALAAIETTIYVDNHASRRVVQKLGFRVTGASEKFCPARNAVVAEDLMRLTRADFAARPGRETAA
jgi:RimJ/RimL family protein N-acetyltransferase